MISQEDKCIAEKILTPKQLDVFNMRSNGSVFRVIGDSLGVSSSRARQIYVKCLRRIKTYKDDAPIRALYKEIIDRQVESIERMKNEL